MAAERSSWWWKAAGVLCLLLAWALHRHASLTKGPAAKPRTANPLFTGKEPRRKVVLTYVSKEKGTLEQADREIYRTASLAAQAKQAVLALMEAPAKGGLAAAFPPGSGLRELFIDKDGLCVVDLTQATADAHPGGTSGEAQTLAALVRSLCGNFPEVHAVQVLVEGERVPSLAGHFDVSGPLTKADF